MITAGMEDARKERRKRVASFLFPALMGLVVLSNVLGGPAIAATRPVDILRIFACGLLFGVAAVNAVLLIRRR